jgi:CheY-like chemotaxis protein
VDIKGFKVRFHLYTVPGQVFYAASRKLILKGVDGVAFVADSQIERMEANIESLDDLKINLAEQGYDPQYGARPLKRLIQKNILNEISKIIISQEVSKNQSIIIDSDNSGLSVRNSEDDIIKALDSGANDYLTKPVPIDELTHIIDKAYQFKTLKPGENILNVESKKLSQTYYGGK